MAKSTNKSSWFWYKGYHRWQPLRSRWEPRSAHGKGYVPGGAFLHSYTHCNSSAKRVEGGMINVCSGSQHGRPFPSLTELVLQVNLSPTVPSCFPSFTHPNENLYGRAVQVFYRPDALPLSQPTMQKHWKKLPGKSPIKIFRRQKLAHTCQRGETMESGHKMDHFRLPPTFRDAEGWLASPTLDGTSPASRPNNACKCHIHK